MRTPRTPNWRGCFVALVALTAASPSTAKSLLGEPEVDRASDGHDGLWCPAEQIQMYDGTFTADGPDVTLRFVATNHNGMGFWRHERIDNVIVVPLADHDATYHPADPALIAAYPCIENGKNYFHFSDVPAPNIVFLEQFHVPPGPEWDLSDGAYSNPTSSALNSFTLPVDTTGGSLGLGLDEDPSLQVTTEVTIDGGFTAGQQYFVSTWTQCADPTVGSDLVIQIYGTEFFYPTEGNIWDPRPGAGMAWGDYDGDGDNDLYVGNFITSNALWENRNGHFIDVTATAGVDDTGPTTAVAWGDYDNDGDLDLYVGSGAVNRLFQNQGNGTFVDVTAPPVDQPQWTASLDWGDYDNDGDLDLFVANDGPDALLRNDGGTSFVDVTAGPVFGIGRPRGCSWVDYDNDRDLDLHVVYSGLPDKLLRNDGGVFVDATPPVLANTELGISGAWADYDNDGDLDAFLATSGTPKHLFRNDGGGAFVDDTPPAMLPPTPGVEGVWGDYDNDGDIDLYFAQLGSSSPNRLLRNDGGGGFSDHLTGTVEDPGIARGAGWADTDDDGDIDLHVVNDGDDIFFRNEIGADNHWLHIDLKGTVSNRSGVGAHITVDTSGLVQLREVGGETGLASQNSLTAEFGLGSVALPSDVTVEWPSGIVQQVNNVGADQHITITEANPTGVAVPHDDSRFVLESNHPNPFRGSTTISYSLAEPTELQLRVFDVAGRLVRTLDEGARSAGRRTIQWNGRDENGQSVAPGIYFYELRAGEWAQTRKMVRMNDE